VTGEGLARWKLFSPFLFLRLKFSERRCYLLLSIFVGIAFGGLYQLTKPPLMGPLGLLEDIKSFVTILFPFFVAALVAIATFTRPGLDDLTSGGLVTLERKGEAIRTLTRRQFVCSIFGYCAGVSLCIFLVVIFTKVTHPWFLGSGLLAVPYFKAACLTIVATMFAHMVIITFWGLYYLSDRLHT